jgi:flavin-dependent dehydrogenase
VAAGSSSYEVAVVGTGPAGAVAAIHLARSGVRVALLDKAPLPRDKTCGGGVVGRARRSLPVDIVGRAAGWPPNRSAIPALECEVRVSPDDFDRFSTSARFDFGAIPHGYAWVFPKADHLSVGVLSLTRGRAGQQTHVDEYLARLSIRPLGDVQRHGYIIPVRPVAGVLVKRRIILVGDAAGLVDPVTGEGSSFAARDGIATQEFLWHGSGRYASDLPLETQGGWRGE